MSDTFEPATRKRHAWLAVVLTLLLTGLGQVYCGRLTRGLVFICLSVVAIPVTAAMVANEVPLATAIFVLAGLIGLVGVTVVALVDAWRLARRTKRDYELKEYNRLAVYLLLYALGKGGQLGGLLYARDHFLEAFIVPSASMRPTIELGDRVLGNKTAYQTLDPCRGDVIIFRDPENWRRNFIKRIVAVGGDTVEMKDGRLIVNGQPLERQAAADQEATVFREVNGGASYLIVEGGQAGSDFGPLTVPPHHCFVLGDNRGESHDSRDFGPVPLTSIVARADYLYWPADGWSRFGRLDR